jgi:four helix bundle protein
MQDFQKLTVWQEAHQLALGIYQMTVKFPADERFGLTNQIRRASVSIPANIAEGSGRDSGADFLRFLHIAMGSASEVEYFLILASDLGFISQTHYTELRDRLLRTKRMLNALIQKIKSANKK